MGLQNCAASEKWSARRRSATTPSWTNSVTQRTLGRRRVIFDVSELKVKEVVLKDGDDWEGGWVPSLPSICLAAVQGVPCP